MSVQPGGAGVGGGAGVAGAQPPVAGNAAAAGASGSVPWSMWSSALMMGYSPEQWTALQHQNWQQWAQWQEQYAQWQLHYGEKYTEQMMNLNNYQVGTPQPPLPPSNPSEARPPPPPDGPPPQVTKQGNDNQYITSVDNQLHKKNQGNDNQYGVDNQLHKKNQQNNYSMGSSSNNNQSNQSYYPYPQYQGSTAKSQILPDAIQNTSRNQNSFNSKKGKNFSTNDFKYSENMQWNDGTIKLDPQQTDLQQSSAWYAQTQASLQYQAPTVGISEEEKQFDIQFKKWEEEFEAWKQQNIDHPDKAAYQEYEKKFHACRAKLMERKEQMKAKIMATMMSQKPPPILDSQKNSINMPYYQSNYAMPSMTNAIDKNAHIYDSGTSKGNVSNNYMADPTTVFGKQSSMKGIPGLDLVDEYSRRNIPEIVDITAENDKPMSSKKPDLKAISKGINNILGDQKLLNMLSIVTQQKNDGNDMNSRRAGSRWVDDANVNSSQGKYPQGQYPYVDGADQSYGQTAYTSNQLPSILDPLPFNTSFYQNSAQRSSQSDDKFTSAPPQLKSDDSNMNYDTNAYQHDMYQSRNEYGNQNNYYDDTNADSYNVDDERQNDIGPAAKPSWMDFPILEPTTIVDYQHQSIKPVIDFFEAVQTFDYGHMSSNKGHVKEDVKSSSLWSDYDSQRKSAYKNFDTQNKELNESDISNDSSYFKSKNLDDRYRDVDRSRRNARNRDYEKRDERSRNRYDDRNRYRDKREKYDRRSNSIEKMPKKLGDCKPQSPPKENYSEQNDDQISSKIDIKNIVMIDDILESPGREVRPDKIVIILRGLPGSGKSYLAKLIKDRELENGGSAPRILSMDDYFMSEAEDSIEDSEMGRRSKKREMKYEYDASMESVYIASLTKAFKRTVTDGFFPFIIVDNINDQYSHYADMENVAKQYGFKVYICEMDVDVQTCHKRNIHSRKLEEIQKLSSEWTSTPARFTTLDATTLLQVAGIDHVQMEDVSDGDIDDQPITDHPTQNEEEEVLAPFSSKWDQMDDTDKLARLDGTSKPLRHTTSTMEDFLQLDDWDVGKNVQPGKKTVRWADIEEKRKQEKMRAIGFVVGQTDWQRMTDPTQGSSALTQTKYIERITRY